MMLLLDFCAVLAGLCGRCAGCGNPTAEGAGALLGPAVAAAAARAPLPAGASATVALAAGRLAALPLLLLLLLGLPPLAEGRGMSVQGTPYRRSCSKLWHS